MPFGPKFNISPCFYSFLTIFHTFCSHHSYETLCIIGKVKLQPIHCLGLTSVTIPGSMTSIGNYVFEGCDNLAIVVSLIQEPFEVRYLVSDFIYKNGTLYVPQGTIGKYKATRGWSDFTWIEELTATGISLPHGDGTVATEVQRYTLDGRSIAVPQLGINIVRMSDGTTRKIIVK